MPLDANGDATVEVPLNDSLTSFRIVAIASAGADLFGTGSATIRSTQDLMLLSGTAAAGARDATASARCSPCATRRSARSRRRCSATVAPDGNAGAVRERSPPQHVDLAPGAAQEVVWDVDVPVGATKLAWQVDAIEGRGDGGRGMPKSRAMR